MRYSVDLIGALSAFKTAYASMILPARVPVEKRLRWSRVAWPRRADPVPWVSPDAYMEDRTRPAFVGAAMGPILNAHSQSIWQSHTPRELQGRVFSIRRLIAWTILPVSTAAGGTLAGLFDPGYVLAALGVTYALFSAAQFFNPYLLRVEDKAGVDASAVRHRLRSSCSIGERS